MDSGEWRVWMYYFGKVSVADVVVDLPGRVDERLLDVGRRLGRRLHEYEAVLARESFAFFPFDVPARFQITWEG